LPKKRIPILGYYTFSINTKKLIFLKKYSSQHPSFFVNSPTTKREEIFSTAFQL